MSVFGLTEGVGGSLFGRMVSPRASVAQSRHVASDWATAQKLDHHMLSDHGLRRERQSGGRRRGIVQF